MLAYILWRNGHTMHMKAMLASWITVWHVFAAMSPVLLKSEMWCMAQFGVSKWSLTKDDCIQMWLKAAKFCQSHWNSTCFYPLYIAWPWVDSIWAPTQEGCSTASKEASKMHCLFFFLLKVVRSGSVPLLFKWKCYLKYLILPSVGGWEGGCFVVVVCF